MSERIVKRAWQVVSRWLRETAQFLRTLFGAILSRLLLRPNEAWLVLRPCRAALFLSVVVSGLVLANAQTHDVLKVVAAGETGSAATLRLLLSVLVFAATAWYFARAVLYIRYAYTPNDTDRHENLRRHTARFVGVLPILAIGVTFLFLGAFAEGILFLAAALMFLLALWARRRFLLPRMYPKTAGDDGEIRAFLHSSSDEEFLERTRPAIMRLTALAVLMFVVVVFVSRVSVPVWVGALGVLSLASAYLTLVFTLLTFFTDSGQRFSLILIVLLIAVVLGLYNDNHPVRTLPGERPAERPTAASHFRDWMASRLEVRAGDDGPIAVFVVAAEGGGIRAAYWTAAVLDALQRHHPRFACNVFSISGVSGGSLGAAAFAADVANAYRRGALDCLPGESPKKLEDKRPASGFGASLDFLGEDALAPVLAGMLFPDLVSRINPFCVEPPYVCFPDRAQYLEEAWETHWQRHAVQSNGVQFSDDLRALWCDPVAANATYERECFTRMMSQRARLVVPSLLLNGTWVEDGGRNVTSNLRPTDQAFVNLDDAFDHLTGPIRLSTAVLMSARFTYVSPPGTLGEGDKARRVVDGGYFENSGAQTATELLRAIDETCRKLAGCPERAQFRVLVVSNSERESKRGLLDRLFTEALSPMRTLLHTRQARGYLAEEAVKRSNLVHAVHEIRLRHLDDPTRRIPLGWMLSSDARAQMRDQADRRASELVPKLAPLLGSR